MSTLAGLFTKPAKVNVWPTAADVPRTTRPCAATQAVQYTGGGITPIREPWGLDYTRDISSPEVPYTALSAP